MIQVEQRCGVGAFGRHEYALAAGVKRGEARDVVTAEALGRARLTCWSAGEAMKRTRFRRRRCGREIVLARERRRQRQEKTWPIKHTRQHSVYISSCSAHCLCSCIAGLRREEEKAAAAVVVVEEEERSSAHDAGGKGSRQNAGHPLDKGYVDDYRLKCGFVIRVIALQPFRISRVTCGEGVFRCRYMRRSAG